MGRDGHTSIVPATIMVYVEGRGAGMSKYQSLEPCCGGFQREWAQCGRAVDKMIQGKGISLFYYHHTPSGMPLAPFPYLGR